MIQENMSRKERGQESQEHPRYYVFGRKSSALPWEFLMDMDSRTEGTRYAHGYETSVHHQTLVIKARNIDDAWIQVTGEKDKE